MTPLEQTVAKNLIANAAAQGHTQFQQVVAYEMKYTLERDWKFELEGVRNIGESIAYSNPLFDLLMRTLPKQLFMN